MLSGVSRVGLKVARAASARSMSGVTTKTTITDHLTGRVIKLSDPKRPELGDYENPKPLLAQDRDPYAKYDDQQGRRNFNEPLNIDNDLHDIWSPDYYLFVSDRTALKHNAIFFSAVIGFGTLIWYFSLNPAKPAMPRSYPGNGLAKDLGSDFEKDDYFYQVRPDTTAEKELGVLENDKNVEKNKKEYLDSNADFLKAYL